MENIHVKLYEIWPVVQEMLFKEISYLELWQPICSMDWKHLSNLEENNMRNNPMKLF